MSTRTRILIIAAAVAGVVVVFLGWQGARAWMAWNSVERVEFDTETARAQLTTVPAEPGSDATSTTTTIPPEDQVSYLSMLVIGSDKQRANELHSEFADAVMLYLVPDDGSGPALVSFPRDTLAVDPCTGKISSLVYMLEPCETYISGPEHVALAMEDLTGIPIDHFAVLAWDALIGAVDAVGGVEICSEYALRTNGYELMPEGCSTVDGEHAFRWIESRQTQAFVDGEWTFVEEMIGDEGRIANRETLLFALMERAQELRSPTDLAAIADSLSDSFLLSDSIGLGDLIAMAWDVRARSDIRVLSIPVEGATLPDGQTYAARPLATVQEILEASE